MATLQAQGISSEEAAKLLSDFSLELILQLLPRASVLRKAHSGDSVSTCSIVNARCGNGGENCAFCAQSSRSKAKIKTWPLLEEDEIFKAAEAAAAHGSSHFGIVTSPCPTPQSTTARSSRIFWTKPTAAARFSPTSPIAKSGGEP